MSVFHQEHPPDADLLVIDIGNTSVTLGTVLGGTVGDIRTIGPDEGQELGDGLASLWAAMDAGNAKRIVIGSVVPATLTRVREAVDRHLGEESLVVSEQIALPMPVDLEHPERVGVDRVCCAAAAHETLRHACVVVDFGTAITIDLVSDDGTFVGGTISPGLELSARSLAEHTAALPLVALRVPDQAVGTDTESAIRAGVVYGALGALREITERFASTIGKWPTLIATGGDAALVANECDFIDRVVPDLCLRGLALAYRLQTAPADE